VSGLLPDGPAARYLDDLADRLPGSGRSMRRTLAEVEDHLAEAAAAEQGPGVDQETAEAAAVARFGAPSEIASQLNRVEGWRLSRDVVRQLVSVCLFVGAVGMLAIGASSVLAVAARAAFGMPFVSDADGVTYTAARCADFREYHPEASTCEAAATLHHYDEVISYRLAAGVLGLVVLLGWVLVTHRRRRATGSAWPALPPGFAATVGAALSGICAIALLGTGLGQLATSDSNGVGGSLSAGLLAATVFVGFAVALWRTMRREDASLA
jgi:HAAS